MSALTVLSLAMVLAITTTAAYDSKFDHWDVDSVIKDDKRVVNYAECFLDKNDCSEPDAKLFKEIIPEILMTACEKCSPMQKTHIKKFIHELRKSHAEHFHELTTKYDAKGEHGEAFKMFLDKAD